MNLNTSLKVAALLSITTITLLLVYYFLLFLPAKEKVAQNHYNQEKIDACIKAVQEQSASVTTQLAHSLLDTTDPKVKAQLIQGINYETASMKQKEANCQSAP